MRARSIILVLSTLLLIPAFAGAFQPTKEPSNLKSKEFFLPELYLSSSAVSLQDLSGKISNRSAWNAFFAKNGTDFHVYLDPRSGTAENIMGPIPLIPGTGVGNKLTPSDLGRALGRKVETVDDAVVAKVFLRWVRVHKDVLGIDESQLGPPRAAAATPNLWHLNIPQVVDGIPVRYARVLAAINHGNMVVVGTENWGNVKISTVPGIGPTEALDRGFSYVEGRTASDTLWKEPALEIIPIAPAKFETGAGFSGPVGSGYGHRLAWTFGFQRSPEVARWQISVDAKTGQVLEMADQNQYEVKQIRGNTYPLTNTEVCPSNDKCGAMVNGSPMPFADTGFAAPNDFTNSAGLFDWTSGSVTSHLAGKYVHMTDTCSTINIMGTPDIDLGGVNGQHDCTLPAPGGVTSAVRSGMYELNRIFEEARGYLPSNSWLNGIPGALFSNMNLTQVCNAFYDGSVNFFRSGGGCRNTGEIAAVFDHEWGHGMDDHDTGGVLSNSSEGYADIASMYRLWASCVGYGFFWTADQGCGPTADGTGFNADEAQTGASHCDLDCSGVRDSDWAKHAGGLPDTVTFTCASCLTGSGPCGRQVHCAATPVRQMAWDFVARDLPSPPFNYDANTSFIIGDKLFYQGSGNVGAWHNCSCPSTSDGCGAANGYPQWLAADDDNGNVNDGTPHMTALFNAYDRHGIACATPTPVNSGCAGGPTAAPVITPLPGNNSVTITWPAVPGAASYNVFRGEGYAGCDFGKVLIGNTPSLSFTDTEVVNGRNYAYVVMAVGTGLNDACFSPASSCVLAAPQPCIGTVVLDQATYSCADTINVNMADGDLSGAGTHTVTVASTTESTPETITVTETPANSGRFSGSINTTSAPPVPGNGILSVTDGDVITLTYHDDSYCGPPQDVTATSVADCVAPAISNVAVINITTDGATVTWDTNEVANARTTHAVAPGPPNTNTDDLSTFGTSHAIPITGLSGCTDYVFSTTSFDPAGNGFTDDNGGAFYTFATGGLGYFLSDDAESGGGDWIVAGTGTSDFHLDTCQANSPSHAWKAGSTSCPGAYGNSVTTTLTSASAFAIETGSKLRYAENYNTQSSADLCRPQISTDGGASWTTLDSYSGDSGGWHQKEYDLSAYAGSSSRFRFLFTSNASVASEGWYLDDIRVTRTVQCMPDFRGKQSTLSDTCAFGGAGNGDGILDQGESAVLLVTAQNLGSIPATGVSGHLSTTTPGVTVSDADATFPDIPSGGTSTSDAPGFTIDVGNSVPCGTSIPLHIDFTTDQGAFSYNFTREVGAPITQTVLYNSADVPKQIPDAGSTTSTTSISDTNTITDVNVNVRILHTSDGDLDLYLLAPGGSPSVELSTDNGGSGDNYTSTTFDDQAAFSITSGSAPFTGTFHPEGNLSDLNGLAANGAWTLNVADDTATNTGMLLSWSMRVTTVTGSVCNACAAACLFCDYFEDGVLSDQWSYSKPSWTETGGALVGTPTGRKAIALAAPAFGGCTNCSVESTMQTAGGTGNRVWMLGWYVDKQNTIELMMKQETNKWVLKERIGGRIVSKAKATLPINVNQFYRARVTFNGTQFDLSIDGAPVLTMPAAGAHTGTVGFQVKATTGTFGEIIVN